MSFLKSSMAKLERNLLCVENDMHEVVINGDDGRAAVGVVDDGADFDHVDSTTTQLIGNNDGGISASGERSQLVTEYTEVPPVETATCSHTETEKPYALDLKLNGYDAANTNDGASDCSEADSADKQSDESESVPLILILRLIKIIKDLPREQIEGIIEIINEYEPTLSCNPTPGNFEINFGKLSTSALCEIAGYVESYVEDQKMNQHDEKPD